MSDIGSNLPVKLEPVVETKAMLKCWLTAKRQEAVSKIVHFKQKIEDLRNGEIPSIERQILAAEQELAAAESKLKALESSIDTQAVEEK